MDLSFAIHCIGPTEPMFLAVIALGVVASVMVWRCLARLGAVVTDPWRRRLYLPPLWAIAGLTLLLGPDLLLHVGYPLLHAHAMVCTAFVWPGFLLPPLVFAILPVVRRLRKGRPARPEQAQTGA
jgi:hypothetical protein